MGEMYELDDLERAVVSNLRFLKGELGYDEERDVAAFALHFVYGHPVERNGEPALQARGATATGFQEEEGAAWIHQSMKAGLVEAARHYVEQKDRGEAMDCEGEVDIPMVSPVESKEVVANALKRIKGD